MGTIHVSAEKTIAAPAETVYGYLADMSMHPQFLPDAFSDFQVESGGIGAGTITRFKVTAGGRTRDYRMEVSEPEPGRVLAESDTGSSLVTTFTVTPPRRFVASPDLNDLARRRRSRRLLRADVRAAHDARHLHRRARAARRLRSPAARFLVARAR